MISHEFIEQCPKCGGNLCSRINQESVITTTCYRKFSHAALIETIQCDECGMSWTDTYTFLHGYRGDWMFATPILKCPICGGDNFEIERNERGTKEGQFIQLRCIDNDDFVWGEKYSFSYATLPDPGKDPDI